MLEFLILCETPSDYDDKERIEEIINDKEAFIE